MSKPAFSSSRFSAKSSIFLTQVQPYLKTRLLKINGLDARATGCSSSLFLSGKMTQAEIRPLLIQRIIHNRIVNRREGFISCHTFLQNSPASRLTEPNSAFCPRAKITCFSSNKRNIHTSCFVPQLFQIVMRPHFSEKTWTTTPLQVQENPATNTISSTCPAETPAQQLSHGYFQRPHPADGCSSS